MTEHAQTSIFGDTIPLQELELTGHVRALADHERQTGQRLTADEAGALIHERRGKHTVDERCPWCTADGTAVLIQLNTFRAQQQAARDPGWTCAECGHENPAEALIYCRRCVAIKGEPPEPRVGTSYDPATAPFPEGY